MSIFAYDFLTAGLTTVQKLERLNRLVTLQEAEKLCYTVGRNLSSYTVYQGVGDYGAAFASSYYIHNMPQAEHPDFCPLPLGAEFRDPPIFINVREGHASQLVEAATLKAYDQLFAMNLTLQKQEHSQTN